MTKSERTRKHEDSFWLDSGMSLVRAEVNNRRAYDLEPRTARFGEAVIDFAKRIPRGPLTDRIISQTVGARTSVGANFVEADDSISKKEFLKCVGTCKKEARETKYFYGWQFALLLEPKDEARKLWMEARELHLIFARIWRTGRQKE